MTPGRDALRALAAASILACLLGFAVQAAPFRVTGTGVVTDSSHPKHPGDFTTYKLTARITFDPGPGEGVLVFESTPPDGGELQTDTYYVRRGRLFQVDDKGVEKVPDPFGDVAAASVPALHPALVLSALRERPERTRRIEGGLAFAWNEELWTVNVTPASPVGRVTALRFDYASFVLGDQTQEVRFESWPADPTATSPGRVVVSSGSRELARIDFTGTEKVDDTGIVLGNRDRDQTRVAPTAEMVPHELAPQLYAFDLASLNMRLFVAEFDDHLLVFEGAWDSRNCDLIAERLREHFRKPVRYFAFSHIHSQYVAGTRTWVHEGATVLVPPTTAPLIETLVKEARRFRPDALAAERRTLRMETVPERRRLEDKLNAAELYNVESGHTDEYLIVYFPRQKVLLTGDLLFYRPGQKLSDRSRKLCENVGKLGLEVERWVATWPLDGYGTKNIVSGEEMRAACAP